MTLPGTSTPLSNLDPWPMSAKFCPRCQGCYRRRPYTDSTGRRRSHHVCDACGATSSDPAVRSVSVERSRCHITAPLPRPYLGMEDDE